MKSETYYLDAARINLLNTSRTAKDGTIDISAAGESYTLCKESLHKLTATELELLRKNNNKANNLCFNNLRHLSKTDIQKLTIANFEHAIIKAFGTAICINNTNFKISQYFDMMKFIEDISKIVGKGIVEDEHWFRTHDSAKFPYTDSNILKERFEDFCKELLNEIENMPSEASAKYSWAMRTAAWVEYRINLTDHFMTDSCGKVASVMSTFVCVLADCNLPIFIDKTEYLAHAPSKPAVSKDIEERNREQYINWEKYYISKFQTDKTSSNILETTIKPIIFSPLFKAIAIGAAAGITYTICCLYQPVINTRITYKV